jgi:hypothetical protein
VEEEGLLLERSNIVYETSIEQDTGSTLGPEAGQRNRFSLFFSLLAGIYQILPQILPRPMYKVKR